MSLDDQRIVQHLQDNGPRTARQVFQQFPQLGDTAGAVKVLRRLVAAQRLAATLVPGGNTQYGSPVETPAPAAAATLSDVRPKSQLHRPEGSTSQRLWEAISRVDGDIDATTMRSLFAQCGIPLASAKKHVSAFVDSGRLSRTGYTKSVLYRRNATTPINGRHDRQSTAPTAIAVPTDAHLAAVLVEILALERRLLQRVLAAALVSPDPVVRRLATSATAVQRAGSAVTSDAPRRSSSH